MKPTEGAFGGFSTPSKMPGRSWSISQLLCKVGGKLRKDPRSPCSRCYANPKVSAYGYPCTQSAMERRFAALKATHGRVAASTPFVRDMARELNAGLISTIKRLKRGQRVGTDGRYFRWMDSGDLQSLHMLRIIVAVAELTPGVQHWLPTREHALVRRYLDRGGRIPENMTVRLSTPFLDQAPTPLMHRIAGMCDRVSFSTVHTDEAPKGYTPCAVYETGENNCRDAGCYACWDANENVSYQLH